MLPGRSARRTVVPLHGAGGLQPSPRRVLEVIGSVTGHLPERRRPDDAARRSAAAVAASLGEIARSVGGDGVSVALPIPIEAAAQRAGLSVGDARRGVELLQSVGALVSVQDGRAGFPPETLEDLPLVAALDTDRLRAALVAQGASVAPALAVAREIAARSSPAAGHNSPWVEARVADLVDATLYRRTAVTRALADLEAAGALERSVREGREGSFRLCPITEVAPRLGAPTPREPAAPSADAAQVISGAGAGLPAPSVAADAAGTLLTIGPRAIVVAAGVPVEVAITADGGCRVTAGALILVIPPGGPAVQMEIR